MRSSSWFKKIPKIEVKDFDDKTLSLLTDVVDEESKMRNGKTLSLDPFILETDLNIPISCYSFLHEIPVSL